MTRVVVTTPVDEDTDEIARYLAKEAGPATALRYLDMLEALYERLADYPESGAPRPNLGRNARIGIVSPFVVIYDFLPVMDTVMVLRIVHGSRRITRKLLRPHGRKER